MRERDEARGQIVIRRVGGLEDQKTYLHPPQFVIRRVGGLEVISFWSKVSSSDMLPPMYTRNQNIRAESQKFT